MLRFFSSTGEQGTGKVGIPETSQAAPSQLLRESIVTRYAEAMFDALIRNSLDDVISYSCRFCSHHFFLKLSKTRHFRKFSKTVRRRIRGCCFCYRSVQVAERWLRPRIFSQRFQERISQKSRSTKGMGDTKPGDSINLLSFEGS